MNEPLNSQTTMTISADQRRADAGAPGVRLEAAGPGLAALLRQAEKGGELAREIAPHLLDVGRTAILALGKEATECFAQERAPLRGRRR
jgi:hypothetical protein